MIVYFSGGNGLVCTPEALVPQRKPHIMTTFHDIGSNGTADRVRAYIRNKGFKARSSKTKSNDNQSRRLSK